LEIRKRFTQPLAIESGEFPDVSNIEGRMLPLCYEAGLVSGHASDAAQFMASATETFIKEIVGSIFSRTRSNGPGDSGNAGFGPGGGWIQTYKYRQQLAREEAAAQRGEVTRDKSGLLPIESKYASERGPLGMADLRIALDIGNNGMMSNFPAIVRSVIYGYKEGELENWDDYTWIDGRDRITELDVEMTGTNGNKVDTLPNGIMNHGDPMDIDGEIWWEGADSPDGDFLDSVLDSCLTAG
jgi:transcriptional coactivator HFI1/ADA1